MPRAHSDSFYSGSEHSQFNSPRLVKREAGFPNPRRTLIGSNQLWRINDSPYYRELSCTEMESDLLAIPVQDDTLEFIGIRAHVIIIKPDSGSINIVFQNNF